MIEKLEATDGILSELMYERAKQIGKGYDAAHDDRDIKGNQAKAGAFYATAAYYQRGENVLSEKRLNDIRALTQVVAKYPWGIESMRIEDTPRENLVKAASLLIAEIERIDREVGEDDE